MTHADQIYVDIAGHDYSIYIGDKILGDFQAYLPDHLKTAPHFFICDENTQQYAKTMAGDRPLYSVKSGEESKSFAELQQVIAWALEQKVDRHSVLIAIGGGVVGDLSGFAASVILRGIPVVQVPTTLLSMVDSSVGGKTGINMPHGKNLVGTFYQPSAVLCDFSVLQSLPERELKAGYAEILKYGLLGNAEFFEWLKQHGRDVLALQPEALSHAVKISCEMKAQIVKEDEKEISGRRALPNLGHTFAHVFEAKMGYDGRLLHGEAVAIGMICAMELSVRKGWLNESDVQAVRAHMKEVGLKTTIAEAGLSEDVDLEKLYERMFSDKKVKAGAINFVVMKAIGQAFLDNSIEKDEVISVLRSCYKA